MLSAIKKRRSIRHYTNQPVEDEKIQEILLAAMCAPSAHNLKPCNFIVVKDKVLIQKLARSTDFSQFAEGAPVIIVITINSQNTPQWIEDASVAAGFIYLEATNQDLGTCWIQIRGMHTHDGLESGPYVRSVLRIPETQEVICLMPVGYPATRLPEHDSSSFKTVKVHRNRW